MERVILHCDLNCFYASVELLSHPELRGVPVAVCGDPEARHGIILAKNEPAKAFGVKTAETIWQAKKKCPDLVLLPPHHDRYAEYSRRVNAIYGDYTDLVEPFGIDESWLDVSGSLHLFGGDAKALADTIRARIKAELGLTISVGVSFNKVFAKLGSDYKKPDATTVIPPDGWQEIVYPLPVGDLLYVGRAAQEVLSRYGVRTIGELAKCPQEMLETLMGKMGTQLYQYANGLDKSPVRGAADREPVKSVGNSTTFRKDLTTWDEVRTGIALLSDSVAMRLRRHGLYCMGVQVGLKDNKFQSVSRQKMIDHSTHLMREINDAALELVKLAWKAPTPIRLLSVTAIHLTPEEETYQQLDLLGQAPRVREKQEKVERAMDDIRRKYGHGAIAYATPKDELGKVLERE
ncbi:MAG: DNA polymerase IV [Oscillospiraceae bacterium]|nr:DNA polymerase IV [Oscillospiraceae bacterium]